MNLTAMSIALKFSDFLGLLINTVTFACTVFIGVFFYNGGLNKILEFILRTMKNIGG